MPVKEPRTCVLPVACPSQRLPKFGILQVLCQSAHGERVVPVVVFDVAGLPPAIAIAAFLSGVPDCSRRVVHSFIMSGTLKNRIGGRRTITLLPDLVRRLNDRKPVLRSISAASPFDRNTQLWPDRRRFLITGPTVYLQSILR
jgi:hypothetical protein